MHKIAYCKTLISLLFASVFKDKQGIPWWLGLSYKGIFQYDHQDKVKPRKVSCLCTTFSLFPTVFFIYWVLIFRYNTNNVILSGAIQSRNVSVLPSMHPLPGQCTHWVICRSLSWLTPDPSGVYGLDLWLSAWSHWVLTAYQMTTKTFTHMQTDALQAIKTHTHTHTSSHKS